jgi:hypothetical protein
MGVRRSVWVVPVVAVTIGVLLVAVFPTRTFLAQQASVRAAEEQLGVLDEQNRLLEDRVRLLNDDAEIERLAREEYHLVRRGEEAYAVLPAPGPPAPLPPVGTPPGPSVDERTALEKARDWVVERF